MEGQKSNGDRPGTSKSQSSAAKTVNDDPNVLAARAKFHESASKLVLDKKAESEVDAAKSSQDKSRGNEPGCSTARHGNAAQVKGRPPERRRKPLYVMRVFDRTVDVVPFNKDVSLYRICHAWMANKPQPKPPKKELVKAAGETKLTASALFAKSGKVLSLPPPEPLPTDVFGKAISCRIPTPVESPSNAPLDLSVNTTFELNFNEEEPSPEALFEEHMKRWKQVRHRWKNAAQRNESRYAKSFEIIENCFKKPSSGNTGEPKASTSATVTQPEQQNGSKHGKK